MATSTPWGPSQHQTKLADGIVFHGTASHGGIWLSQDRQKQLNWDKNWLKSAQWWEEDCDWCIPYYFFRDEIIDPTGNQVDAALQIIKGHHPDFAAREGLI